MASLATPNRWRFVRSHNKPIHGRLNRHLPSRWYFPETTSMTFLREREIKHTKVMSRNPFRSLDPLEKVAFGSNPCLQSSGWWVVKLMAAEKNGKWRSGRVNSCGSFPTDFMFHPFSSSIYINVSREEIRFILYDFDCGRNLAKSSWGWCQFNSLPQPVKKHHLFLPPKKRNKKNKKNTTHLPPTPTPSTKTRQLRTGPTSVLQKTITSTAQLSAGCGDGDWSHGSNGKRAYFLHGKCSLAALKVR